MRKISAEWDILGYVYSDVCAFLARLDEVQEELLYYPRRRRWRRWRRRRR